MHAGVFLVGFRIWGGVGLGGAGVSEVLGLLGAGLVG